MKRTLIALAIALVAVAALAAPGLAGSRDNNRDRIPDKWEKRHHLSLKVDQSNRDQDRDDADNLCEFRSHDNPRDADTDEDGIEDENEADEIECENEVENENENEAGDDHRGPNRGPGGGTEDNSGPGNNNDD